MKYSRLDWSLLVFALLANWGNLWAQGTAQINGKVTDPSGAAVPGAQITVTQTATNSVRATTSATDGSYVLPDLPIGPYVLDVNKEGFNQYRLTGIVLEVSGNPTIDVALKVGNVSEQVVVEANAAQVETQETGVAQVIDNKRVLELPLAARASQQLILMAGGSVGGGAQASGNTYPVNLISVAGAQTDAVRYVLDGGVFNEPVNGTAMPTPFPDALQEFRVETSAASARYGGNSGGTIEMVTKSGTNEFHGTAFEFLRNGDLNARNTFAATVDQLKRNQFGGVIGGPVKKDKLFFFYGDQYTKTISAPGVTVANVITQQMLAGDWTQATSPACNGGRQITLKAPFVGNKISPSMYSAPAVALTHQKGWIIPNNACGIDTFTSAANLDEQMILAKVDYQISTKNSIFVRTQAAILHQPTPYNGVDILSMTQGNYTRHANSLAVGDTLLISNTMVATFRATALRTINNRVTPDGVANFNATDLGVQGVWYPGNFPKLAQIRVAGGFIMNMGSAPNFAHGTDYEETGDFTWSHGAHQMGFGVDILHANAVNYNTVNAPGQFMFAASNTGLGLADFMLGETQNFQQSMPATTYLMQYYPALYFLDTWKANRHLTVSGGLRWEPYLSPTTKYLQAGVFNNAWFLQGLKSMIFKNAPAGLLYSGDPGVDLGNSYYTSSWARFAPRLGIAFDPQGDGKTVVRIAAGSFSDYLHLGANSSNIALEPPTGGRVNISGANLANPWATVPGGNPFPLTYGPDAFYPIASNISTIPLGIKKPTIWEWNAVVQKQLSGTWLASLSYIGSLAVHETSGHEGNPGVYIPGNCAAGQYGLTAPGLCTTTANLNQRRLLSLENPAQGQFYSALPTLDSSGTRSYNGMVLSLQRRVSTGFTVLGNYTLSHCIDYGITTDQTTIQTWTLSRRPFNRGNCELDRRHNFNVSAVYQLPGSRLSNHFANLLLSNWQVSTVAAILSGPWVSVTSGVDNAGTGTGDEWASLVGTISPYAPNRGTSSRVWLNPAAFTQPTLGTYGNMNSQSLQCPGRINVDVALARGFNIRERMNIQVRAEAFNVLNHVNPGAATGTPAGTSAQATQRSGIDLTLTDPLFGQIVNAADPRIMQIAAKFTF